jgi:chemotaxis protein MotB
MSHGGGDSGRWLISYADLLTLLFALFVVLYALGQTDVAKYKQLAEAFRRAFGGGGGGPTLVIDPGIKTGGAGTGESSSAPVDITGMPQRPSDTLDVASDLSQMLQDAGLADGVSVQNNVEGVLLSVSETLLFAPDEAVVLESAYPVLDRIVAMMKDITNEIRVTAYTDDTPPGSERYPSNWELSAARAASIVRYVASQGIDPERLTAAGRGQYHPLFPNDSEEHRAYNRRAEIVVIYTIEYSIFGLGPNTISAASSP